MKSKGKSRRKTKKAPVMVPYAPSPDEGYQHADCTTTSDVLGKTEFDSRSHSPALQAEFNVAIEKRYVDEKLGNNVSSFRQASTATKRKQGRVAGRVSTNTSIDFGSSSMKPVLDPAPAKSEKSCQEPRLPHQDPRYNVEELNAALLVIRIIMRSDAAEPFNLPVNPIALGIPDYFDIIDTPMDFGTICKNLENGVKYMNSEDVFKDVQLIWENCCKYNKKGNYVLELMKRVKTNFMEFWAAAKLYTKQLQASSGYSPLQPPMSSSAGNLFRVEYPVASDIDYSTQQLQDRMDPSQVQSDLPSPISNHINRPTSACNMRHHKHGQGCPVGSDTENSSHQLQKRMSHPLAVNGHSDRPTMASSTRGRKRAQGSPMGPSTGKPVDQLQDQINPNQIEAQHPSSIHSQRHQPKRSCNKPQHSLLQPHTSSNQPQGSPQRPETSSNTSSSEAQGSLQDIKANKVLELPSTGKQRKSRARGPTRCHKLWIGDGKRIYVATNDFGQPIGPEAPKLMNYLGTVARDGLIAPLIYADWRAMPDANKEKMLQKVESKFDINHISKDWIMKSLGTRWKDFKARLKSAHYNIHATDEERIADRDERVLPDQWAALVSYWSSAEAEARSAQNKVNRAQQKFNHATGTKSFARLLEEERAKRPDGKEPSRSELFVLTRTRKDGRPVNEASAAVISQLQECANQQQDDSPKNPDDLFSEIMIRDRRSRVRYGPGLSPPSITGFTPTHAEAIRMVSVANSEVREMKDRMLAMEQTCAQMATQMSTMMVMMSSMQKFPDKDQSNFVMDSSDTSEGVPRQLAFTSTPRQNSVAQTPDAPQILPQQIRSSASRRPVSPHETCASKRSKMKTASTNKKDA